MVSSTALALVLVGLDIAPHPTWDGMPDPVLIRGGALDAGPALATPWMCEQTEYCTQGHNGGSHTGTSAWAWDFALQEGEEIWAASAGTVTHLRMSSTTGGCDSAFINDANYVTIDHGDGTSITYVHMLPNSSPLAIGEAVEVGDLIARVGATGWACGAHLHMQVMETCGGSYCNSLQAMFIDHGDPVANTQYTSTNCPTCAKELAGGVTVIDDEDAGCFVRETTAWASSFSGHNDHHFTTLATDAAAPESIGTWLFVVSTPGDYLVEVHVPETDAETTNAVYEVVHTDGTDMVAIDQSTHKGWQQLGTFRFEGGAAERVQLGDNTGENLDALMRKIAYDAVRFTYMPSSGGSEGGDTTAGDSGDGGDEGSDGSTGGGPGSADDGAGPGPMTTDDGDTGSALSGSDALPPGPGSAMGDGCACRSEPGWPGAAPLWLLVFAVTPRRRRSSLAFVGAAMP